MGKFKPWPILEKAKTDSPIKRASSQGSFYPFHCCWYNLPFMLHLSSMSLHSANLESTLLEALPREHMLKILKYLLVSFLKALHLTSSPHHSHAQSGLTKLLGSFQICLAYFI